MSDEKISGVVSLFDKFREQLSTDPHASVVSAILAAALHGSLNNTSATNNRPASGGSRNSGPVEEVTGVLEAKEKKPCAGGTKYSVKVGGKYYSAFDAKVFGGNVFQEGDSVKLKYTKSADGKYKNIVSVEPVNDLDQGGSDIPF